MLLHLSDSILLSKNTRSISVQKRWDWNKEKKKKKRGNAFHEKEKNIVVSRVIRTQQRLFKKSISQTLL